MTFNFLNWIEAFEALTQLSEQTQREVLACIQEQILHDKLVGEVDPLIGRSVRYEVRPGLLLLCDVDRAARSVDLLSIELSVAKASLA